MNFKVYFFLSFLFMSPFLRAHFAFAQSDKLDKILVKSQKSLNIHKDHTVTPTQFINYEEIQKRNKGNLNELIDEQPGIDVQDYCVNCGAKRLSINGMRGEHTSILTDGVPLFSSISSVYGVDTISTLLIQEIEVLRGSGSALIYPESIGGALNLITLTPLQTGGKASYQYSTHNNMRGDMVYSLVNKKYKSSFGGDFDIQKYWDEDNNGVSEFPSRNRISVFAKTQTSLNENLKFSLRGSYSHLEVMGGSTKEIRLNNPITLEASETDFQNGDVRRQYTGNPRQLADYLKISRADVQGQLKYYLTESSELETNFGSSLYMQQAIYSHAFDYDNMNPVFYIDGRWNKVHNEELFSILGVSHRREYLRSDSEVMYETAGIAKDDFNFYSTAAFLQTDWHVNAEFEISGALRFDYLSMNRLEGESLNKSIVTPRVNAKWQPTENLAHYLSYGMGYRMPLSFTESAHGIYSDGFVILAKELETSHSLVYMFSLNHENYYFTPSFHYTFLQKMAYDEEPTISHTGPVEFVNDSKDHHIFVSELLAGYKPLENILLEVSYENFNYDSDYKSKIPTAAIENRLGFKSAYEWKDFKWNVGISYIFPRDLSAYVQYEDHYNINNGLLGADAQKNQRAPGYTLVQTSVTYSGVKNWEFNLGVNNLLDQTQVSFNDSPAMWHYHDGHAHFDNRHVWGPNQGREVYLKGTYIF